VTVDLTGLLEQACRTRDALQVGHLGRNERTATPQHPARRQRPTPRLGAVMSGLPTPKRTLRNEIARGLMEAHDWRYDQMRYCLDDAGVAVEALRNYVLVFGPAALIEAL